MKISDTVKYIGVNDHEVDLFEGQYVVPNGMSYNSYAIIDKKIAIMDTVDARFTTSGWIISRTPLAHASPTISLSSTWSPTTLPTFLTLQRHIPMQLSSPPQRHSR